MICYGVSVFVSLIVEDKLAQFLFENTPVQRVATWNGACIHNSRL